MTRILITIVLLLLSLSLNAQDERSKEGTGFKSVFRKRIKGDFKGSLNGLFQIEEPGKKDTCYTFLNDTASLHIEWDRDTIYDVSWKRYWMENKDIKICYTTYSCANNLEITINEAYYARINIDGDCSFIINGIDWSYFADRNRELLFLYFDRDVILERNHKVNQPILVIKKGSTLCFDIKRIQSK